MENDDYISSKPFWNRRKFIFKIYFKTKKRARKFK